MRNRLLSVFGAVVTLTLILTACVPAATPAPSAPATEAPKAAAPQPTAVPPTAVPKPTEAPKPTATSAPKVLRVAFPQEPDSLNPYYSNMWFAAILGPLYLSTGLIVFNDKNEAVPLIAKEIPSTANGGISADGKVITYKLRDDIKWSDGEPLTADDYVFTWQMVMNDKNTVLSRDPFDVVVDKVEAKDKSTLVVTFKEPYAPWQAKIFTGSGGPTAGAGALPKHILEPVFQKDGTLDNAEWNRKPTVGIGPYLFKEWQSGSHLIFVANPNYWQGKPKLDQIYIRIVPDDAAQLAALKAGDSDVGTFIDYSVMPDLEKLGTVDLVKAASGYQESLFFNLSTDAKTKGHPALQDVNVRKAVVMAVDRQKIVKDLLGGRTKVSSTFWEDTPYADPSQKPLAFDATGAKKLLDDAGWKVGADGIREKDGVKLKLRYATTTRDVRKSTQVIVQQMLKDVGIDVELINHASDLFFAGYGDQGPIAMGQYDIEQHSSNPAFPDPDYVSWTCREVPSDKNPSGTNYQYFCDKELDDLFTQQAVTVDSQARIQLFYKIGKILNDKLYWVSLWDDPDWWAISKKLKNARLSGGTPFWNAYNWSLE
ncbi:MAG: peptide ABC transporter substrate-binding protein [Chloroflexi bacterium]|nr:peptide ABC transporter substrate-binding protein [Chloroflexota bacterium]